jgi:integrase
LFHQIPTQELPTMALTDTAIRAAKPSPKLQKLSDGGGLQLWITPNGGKYWRMAFRFLGKQKLLALGTYPEVSLKDARERREEARKALAAGSDPGEARKAEKAQALASVTNTFEAVAREWFDGWRIGKAKRTQLKTLAMLENDLFPALGATPIADISAPVALAALRGIAYRKPKRADGEAKPILETAHKAKVKLSQVMRYAVQTGRAERDPVPDLKGALPSPEVKHYAAITDPVKLGDLLRSFDKSKGSHIVRCALRLSPLLFQRPGELRQMRWHDLDLDAGEWRFFVTKTKVEHIVPLARQSVEILRELHKVTGRGEYVFQGAHDYTKPMSSSTVNHALQALGWDTQKDITGHGFRATARTIIAERLKQFPDAYIERQLSHKVQDPNGTAYNRTQYLDDRRLMMQTWADYLDQLKAGAQVIPLRTSAA